MTVSRHTPAYETELLGGGVDVITGGNHTWDGPEVAQVLRYDEMLRPANVDEPAGRGVATLTNGAEALTVVNLLSPTAALPGMLAPQPYPLWQSWRELARQERLAGNVLIDLHGESAWEKASFATAIDGDVTAVLGTHTHDPTLRGHILPGAPATSPTGQIPVMRPTLRVERFSSHNERRRRQPGQPAPGQPPRTLTDGSPSAVRRPASH